ncbi:MAG: ribbon-helix-helix domain-containing protein [Candidatus Saliniplasma sp.]
MGTKSLKNIQARVPTELYDEIDKRIESGMYASKSEVIREALRKMFAEQSRNFLRDLAEKRDLSEDEMLEEWIRVREGA